MELSHLRLIAQRALAKGLIKAPEPTPTLALPENTKTEDVRREKEVDEEVAFQLPATGNKERERRLKKHIKNGLELDFEVMSSFLSLEINAEVSPLRLNTMLTKRIAEMKADGSFKKVPKVVLEMLESLRIPNFAPLREQEYSVTIRSGNLVISGEGVESSLRSKSVQSLIKFCEWKIEGSELSLSGGFVAAFSPSAVQQIWSNCRSAC